MSTRANSNNRQSKSGPRPAASSVAPPAPPRAAQPISDLHRLWYGTPAGQPAPASSQATVRAAAPAPRREAGSAADSLAALHAVWFGGTAAAHPAGSGPLLPQSVGPVAPAAAIAQQISQLHLLWDRPSSGAVQPLGAGAGAPAGSPLQPLGAGPTPQPVASSEATNDLLDQLRGGNN